MLVSSNSTLNFTQQPLAQPTAGLHSPYVDGTTVPFLPTWQNILGMVLSVVVSIVTGPGGQGGSGFYIPMFNVLLNFSVAESAAITSFVVFLGCISSTVTAMAAPHPTNPDKARIDYITVVVLLPALLLGVSYGVMANAVLPGWLLNILLMLVWTWSCWKLFTAFRGAFLKERQALRQAKQTADMSGNAQLRSGAINSNTSGSSGPDSTVHHNPGDQQSLGGVKGSEGNSFKHQWQERMSSRLQGLKSWCGKQPWVAIFTILGLFVGFVGLTVVREVRTIACHGTYWAVLAVQSGLLVATAVAVSAVLIRQRTIQHTNSNKRNSSSTSDDGTSHTSASSGSRHGPTEIVTTSSKQLQAQQQQPQQQFSTVTSDASSCILVLPVRTPAPGTGLTPAPWRSAVSVSRIKALLVERAAARQEARALAFILNEEAVIWSVRKLLITPGLMLMIGIIASMLGVGGAALVSPLILSWGLHPQVGAATSRMILMLSTGASSLSFLAAGRMNVAYALVYGGINVVFTPLGICIMDWFVRKTGHPSYVTMLSLVRTFAGVVVQTAFSLAPALIVLHNAPPPMLGFNAQGLCH